MTDFAKQYIELVRERHEQFSIPIDRQKFQEFILTLPPAEQWMLKLSYPLKHIGDYEQLIRIVTYHVPFIPLLDNHYYLPSTSIINFIISQMSEKPVRSLYMFGKIEFENFLTVRKENLHPTALYHPDIPDNTVYFHGLRTGILSSYLHDLTHVFWVNLFTPYARNQIYQHYIPLLQKLHRKAEQAGLPPGTIQNIQLNIMRMSDFCLGWTIENYYEPTNRFGEYLKPAKQLIIETCADLQINHQTFMAESLIVPVQEAVQPLPTIRK